jgi:hypothetical protein
LEEGVQGTFVGIGLVHAGNATRFYIPGNRFGES